MFYGLTVMETLMAEVQTVAYEAYADLAAINALAAGLKVANKIYVATDTGLKYRWNGTAFVVITNTSTSAYNVYTSYLLGKDPYVVTKLGSGAVEFKMTGFEASKDDPLGQISTFGYRMWSGAKVIDPLAITKIYSRSQYDVLIGMDYDYVNKTGTGPDDVFGAVADQTTTGEDEENI
jgi:hypothetical protein